LEAHCDRGFHANTFDEIAELRKKYETKNKPHLQAMNQRHELLKSHRP